MDKVYRVTVEATQEDYYFLDMGLIRQSIEKTWGRLPQEERPQISPGREIDEWFANYSDGTRALTIRLVRNDFIIRNQAEHF